MLFSNRRSASVSLTPTVPPRYTVPVKVNGEPVRLGRVNYTGRTVQVYGWSARHNCFVCASFPIETVRKAQDKCIPPLAI